MVFHKLSVPVLLTTTFLLCLLSACLGSGEEGCVIGGTQCLNDSTYQICGEDAEWSPPRSCEEGQICAAGTCRETDPPDGDEPLPVCTSGDTICVGDMIQRCDPQGQWETPLACPSGEVCRSGICTDGGGETICAPDQTQCLNEETLQTCNDAGIGWIDTSCGMLSWCYEGVCIPKGSKICEALTDTHCRDLQTKETCNAEGTGWENPEACASGERCYGGQCVDEDLIICEPGLETRCSTDDRLQGCNETGTGWGDPFPCPETFICQDGRCIEADCEPGTDFRCTSRGWIQWCNAEGDGYHAPEECEAGLTCVDDSENGCDVSNQVCVPNGTGCDAENPQVILQCNEDGTAWLEETLPCPNTDGGRCLNGACMDLCDLAELKDSYIGCEYWPVVLPNPQLAATFKNGNESEYAVVVSNTNDEYAAKVDIEYLGGNFTKSVTVQPGQDQTVRLPYYEIENTIKAKKAFRLNSSVPVTVYQFNPITARKSGIEANTNDASLLLPTHVLGTDYMVMNYRSFGMLDDANEMLDSFYTVVATTNGTVVDITSSNFTRSGGGIAAMSPGGTQQVTLDEGEVLQVVSDTSRTDGSTCYYGDQGYGYIYCLAPDTSGTHISTSQPVAVYAGNECQFVPHYRWACDHLEQQMFPTDAWTTMYIGAWMQPPVASHPNIYKILALEDGTELTTKPNVNSAGTPDFRTFSGRDCSGVLNRGESCMIETQNDFVLIANPGHPVLMGQFLVAQNYDGLLDNNTIGDPAFILIPPVEQYRYDYVFLVPNTYETSWITLLTTSDDISITLDGSPLNFQATAIGPTDISAFKMNMIIGAGTHVISADKRLGLLVYGYDRYVSYAYPAGLDLSYIPY